SNQTTATDAVQGQAEIAKLLGERTVLEQQRKTLEAKLNQLMARPEAGEIQLPDKLEIPTWDADLKALQDIAMAHPPHLTGAQHPGVMGAHHRIEEKQWAVKAAKREWYPDFSTQLEYVQKPGATQDAFTGQLMLNVPLLVGKKRAGVKQAEAELASANYTHEA